MLLDPWIVEAALARFAEKQLTREQQEVVLKATRTRFMLIGIAALAAILRPTVPFSTPTLKTGSLASR